MKQPVTENQILYDCTYYEVLRIAKIMTIESRMVVVGAEGRREWELLFQGHRVSVLKIKSIVEMDDGNGCTTIWMYLMP